MASASERRKRRAYDSRRYRRARAYVLRRDGYTCRYCGGPADEADHVIPLARGGSPFSPSNLVAACKRCNSGRGAGPPTLPTGTIYGAIRES